MATAEKRKINEESLKEIKAQRLDSGKRYQAYASAERLFRLKFNKHMIGGDLQEFKRNYRTLYELVIIPAIEDAILSNPISNQ